MTRADSLDLAAPPVPTEPFLGSGSATLSYAETQGLSRSVAASLRACGVDEGDTVGVLAGADPLAVTCLIGARLAGAAWTLVDPAEATVVDQIHAVGACSLLFHRTADAELARELQMRLPRLQTLVCLDGPAARGVEDALGWGEFLVAGVDPEA